jgi:hypothetical protein
VAGRCCRDDFDVGMDALSPVSTSYPRDKPHFPFTGTIKHVTFDFDGVGNQMTPREKQELRVKMD